VECGSLPRSYASRDFAVATFDLRTGQVFFAPPRILFPRVAYGGMQAALNSAAFQLKPTITP